AEDVAEDAVDRDVVDVDDAAGERAVLPERRRRVLGAVTEAVVHRAAVRGAQDLIRRVDLFEAHDGLRVARVLGRVMLRSELAEGDLDLFLSRRARDAEDFVMVALRHRGSVLRSTPRGFAVTRAR